MQQKDISYFTINDTVKSRKIIQKKKNTTTTTIKDVHHVSNTNLEIKSSITYTFFKLILLYNEK